MRKDFRDILAFITVAFILPPILISSGNVYAEVLGYVSIACAFLFVYSLDAKERMVRQVAKNQAELDKIVD